jgi:cytochrome c oxidase cbb3-type subunit 3
MILCGCGVTKMRMHVFFLGVLLPFSTFALGGTPLLAQAGASTLPAGVTSVMVSAGEAIFKGQGACFACHGADAKGMPNLGANLTDSVWVHSDGSYAGIVKTITDGTRSASGVTMPPDGGASLSAEAVKEVAAYVWSLSHPKKG